MTKKKIPMFKIIKNEQTPASSKMLDEKQWIENNGLFLNSFVCFCRSQKKAAGLASNQIAFNGKRIFDRFFCIREGGRGENWIPIINPIIKEFVGESSPMEEGCLTWPGKKIIANRHNKIIVSFYKYNGDFVDDKIIDGYEAQVWQHEVDHLDGKTEEFKEKIEETKIGRNEQCPCKSGKKYKKCCGI